LYTHWKLLHSVETEAWNELERYLTDTLDIFEALNDLLQKNPGFQPGKRGCKANMDTRTKTQVLVRRALDIKDLRISPLLFVTIGRPEPTK
jgi:hypothetical protein